MQKKLLGLQRNQIFNQGRFLSGDWGGGSGAGAEGKVIWKIVCTSEKILATPLYSNERIEDDNNSL